MPGETALRRLPGCPGPPRVDAFGMNILSKTGEIMRELVILECTECKRRNYRTMKEKRNTPERIEKKKYCKFERKHTVHRETR